jgi:hypothetical protein
VLQLCVAAGAPWGRLVWGGGHRVLAWVLFAYFAVGVGMNVISRSRAERLTMTPVCAVLAAATLVVALS